MFFNTSSIAFSNIQSEVGDTFLIEREAQTPFHRWNVQEYSSDYLDLIETVQSPEEFITTFIFRAIEEGTTEVILLQSRHTAFGIRDLPEETVEISINPPPAEPEDTHQPLDVDPFPSPVSSERRVSPQETRGTQFLDEVNELLELERFAAAREIINERINDTSGQAKQNWMEKLAESYMLAEEFQQAVERWRDLVEEFDAGPVAGWLMQMARAHMQDDNDDQAQLLLLRVRYRHQNTAAWFEAMQELANLAIANENYTGAREILEQVRTRYEGRTNPRLVFRLAELYDRQAAVRNYERAVELYREVSDLLQDSEPKLASQALNRAQYLDSNYINFGIE